MIKPNGNIRGVFDQTIQTEKEFLQKLVNLIQKHSSSFLQSKENFRSFTKSSVPIAPTTNIESLRNSGHKRFLSHKEKTSFDF